MSEDGEVRTTELPEVKVPDLPNIKQEQVTQGQGHTNSAHGSKQANGANESYSSLKLGTKSKDAI